MWKSQRKRFSLFGVSVLSDAPRSGTPRVHDDDKIAEIIRLTTTTEPKNSTAWSTTEMAKVAGVSQSISLSYMENLWTKTPSH